MKKAYQIGKSISTSVSGVNYGKRSSIRIPQPTYRPISVNTLKHVDTDQPEIPWFMLHRRGVRRILVGEDPREARAVSHDSVAGTLPERILYKALIQFKLFPGADFDFQSSISGGRMQLGGIVADFVFPYMLLIIQVQGPTHDEHRRARKDQEQKMILADMGYHVEDINDEIIYDEYRLEEELRRIFNRGPNWAGAATAGYTNIDWWTEILARTLAVESTLEATYVG